MPIWILWGGWLLVVLSSWLWRSRLYAAFSGVVLGLVTVGWSGLSEVWGAELIGWPPGEAVSASRSILALAVAFLQVSTWLHFLSLIRPRLRSLPFRFLVTWPGLWMIAGSWLALPWALVGLVGLEPHGWWLPFAVSIYGLWESMRGPMESVELPVFDASAAEQGSGEPRRVAVVRRSGASSRSRGETALDPRLRIAHLTDPHLGAFVSARRLRDACRRIVAAEPDLVAITGDFLTMESQSEVERLTWALEPLAALADDGTPVVACRGNHDLEAPLTVEEACSAHGIELLLDARRRFSNLGSLGVVDVVGLDYRFPETTAQLRQRLASETAVWHAETGSGDDRPGLVIFLAHGPASYRRLTEVLDDERRQDVECSGVSDSASPCPTLTLSGHLHGGQLGLLRLGVDWTILRLARRPMYEHGLWRRGRHHLYTSRGFGHYGFPLRIGVPAELSVLELGSANRATRPR